MTHIGSLQIEAASICDVIHASMSMKLCGNQAWVMYYAWAAHSFRNQKSEKIGKDKVRCKHMTTF